MLIIIMTMMIFVMMIMIRMARVLRLILADLFLPLSIAHFSTPVMLQGVYMMILRNFERHYQTNRAPFGLFYHPAWWAKP